MHDAAATTRPFTLQLAVTLTAVIHPEPDAVGFSAEVPALPGCYTQGETLEEVQANLKEAAEVWLAFRPRPRRAAPRRGRGMKPVSGKRMCRLAAAPGKYPP